MARLKVVRVALVQQATPNCVHRPPRERRPRALDRATHHVGATHQLKCLLQLILGEGPHSSSTGAQRLVARPAVKRALKQQLGIPRVDPNHCRFGSPLV